MQKIEMLDSVSRDSIRRPQTYNPFADVRERFILDNLNREVAERLADWAKSAPKGARLLDIGCGQQPYRERIERLGFQYVSFDFQQNDLGRVDFLGRIDGELPAELLAAGAFDYILCTEVIEHVLHWEQLFGNLRKILKNGGKALLTCPFTFPLHEEPYDYYRPTLHALAGWAALLDLRVVRAKKLGSIVDVLGLILGHCLLKMPYRAPSGILHRLKLSLEQRLVRFVLLAMHRLIRWGFFSGCFASVGDFYVTNSIELERNAASG